MSEDCSSEVVEYTAKTQPHTSTSLFNYFVCSQTIVAGLVAYIGSVALHFWTAYLFFEHWGPFWAIACFCVPPFGELIALGACFTWGVWYYVLAVAAFCAGAISFSMATDLAGDFPTTSAKRFFVGTAILLYLLLFSFGFFALRASILPKTFSEFDRQEIEDVSCAVCSVLKACSSYDPTDLSELAAAKERLRRKVAEYDKQRKDEVKHIVDAYLRAYVLMARDSKAYYFNAQHSELRDSLGADTREAIANLPVRMRVTEAELEAGAKGVRQQISGAMASGVRQSQLESAVNAAGAREWQAMSKTYKGLLGCQMPSYGELLNL